MSSRMIYLRSPEVHLCTCNSGSVPCAIKVKKVDLLQQSQNLGKSSLYLPRHSQPIRIAKGRATEVRCLALRTRSSRFKSSSACIQMYICTSTKRLKYFHACSLHRLLPCRYSALLSYLLMISASSVLWSSSFVRAAILSKKQST